MANPKKALILSSAAGGASLLSIAIVVNSLVSGGMVFRDIETSEHADDVLRNAQLPASPTEEQILNLNGYWKKSVVTVSFIPRGLSQTELEPMVKGLKETMRISDETPPTNSTDTYQGWPDLLYTLSMSTNVPSLKTIENGSESADIRVYLHSENHPENKLGLAKIARDKVTYEIVYAEIHVYAARSLQEDQLLGYVFKHELGHALGLGHSSMETSVMHSPIVLVNDAPIGDIRECEAQGTALLYSGSIGEINCALSGSTSQ